MGFFSYDCKECGHPLLCRQATDAGINDWMSDAVALGPDGSRILGEYDGYGRIGDTDSLHWAACLHRACWELAGKPEWDRYGSPSAQSADQGWFFDDGAHDLVDPRMSEGRDEILRKGVEDRVRRRFDARATEVYEAVHGEPLDEEDRPWRRRFHYGPAREAGKRIPGRWYRSDAWRVLFEGDNGLFDGTESGVVASLQAAWDEFVAGDECRALLARAEEIRAESRERWIGDLKKRGRYRVGWGPSRKGGDDVGGFRAERTRFYVTDELSFEEVASFDYEGEPRSFGADPDYPGNHSPEWEARVEENRAEAAARRGKADEMASRLNVAWAAAGHPVPEEIGA